MLYDYIIYFFGYEIFNNYVYQIFFAIVAFLLIRYGLKFVISTFKQSLKKFIQNKKSISIEILEIIKSTPKYILVILSLYLPFKILNTPDLLDRIVDVISSVFVILWLINICDKLTIFIIKKLLHSNWKVDETSQKWLNLLAKIIIRIIWILLILMNIWVEITPLIASLWIGWIAVAFAMQNILKDLFSSFSILVSKPFKIWDFVEFGAFSWTVKDTNLKNTRIVATGWEDIIVPNSYIMDNTIKNTSSRTIRRKKFIIWVTYQTPTKILRKIPDIMKKIISKFKNVAYERTTIINLGSSSIDFEISYFLKETDLDLYLNTNHEITLQILESFEKEKINIAYPTQVIYTQTIK